ncbi:Alpha-L-arabinofuranosidase 1 [Zea mays]|nr:Alpha-L-arabinofuranosidase 1 [Zea mays]
MLHFFKESSGATLHPTAIQVSSYDQLVASAITWQNAKDKSTYLRIKVVNFGNQAVDLNISVVELATGVKKSGSKQTVLTSSSPLDENSFQQPEKVGARRTESVGSACSGLYITDNCVCVCMHACRWRQCRAQWRTRGSRWALPWGRTPSPRLTCCWSRASMTACKTVN